MTWDFTGRVKFAIGSDLWPLTWGADGKVWGGWGDGGGFQGDDVDHGRVSLGFGEICVLVRSAFTVNTLSANLVGGELLQLANDDKFSKAATQLTFTVDHAATVYVAVDSTIAPRASWLDATWTRDTASVFKWNNAGNTIATFDVYEKAFPAGTVSLGGNLNGTTATSAHSNYTVIVH